MTPLLTVEEVDQALEIQTKYRAPGGLIPRPGRCARRRWLPTALLHRNSLEEEIPMLCEELHDAESEVLRPH